MCWVCVCRVSGGELFERIIDDDFILTERACVSFMRQTCRAMEYIHSRNIVHLDMKVSYSSSLQVLVQVGSTNLLVCTLCCLQLASLYA